MLSYRPCVLRYSFGVCLRSILALVACMCISIAHMFRLYAIEAYPQTFHLHLNEVHIFPLDTRFIRGDGISKITNNLATCRCWLAISTIDMNLSPWKHTFLVAQLHMLGFGTGNNHGCNGLKLFACCCDAWKEKYSTYGIPMLHACIQRNSWQAAQNLHSDIFTFVQPLLHLIVAKHSQMHAFSWKLSKRSRRCCDWSADAYYNLGVFAINKAYTRLRYAGKAINSILTLVHIDTNLAHRLPYYGESSIRFVGLLFRPFGSVFFRICVGCFFFARVIAKVIYSRPVHESSRWNDRSIIVSTKASGV